jgi:hypothetical protein
MKKNKLPVSDKLVKVHVVSNSTTSNASPMKTDESRERKWKAEDALRDIERAEQHKKDKSLMKDVKSLAKEKIKSLGCIK